MKQLPFKTCEFVKSAAGKDFPRDGLPHIALVGRSNVGKSSFLNYLFRTKSLAHVSATPGKTRLINFFKVDEMAYLVDLPGFGYAKRGKEEIESINTMLNNYFLSEHHIEFVHLLDVRHAPSKEDHLFIDWLKDHGKKPLHLFTKFDKIKKNGRKAAIDSLLSYLGDDTDYIPMSIHDETGRRMFLQKISERVIRG
jgi:GTP-binding protein